MIVTRRTAVSLLAGASATLAAPNVWGQNRASNVVICLGADPSFAPFIVAMKKGMLEKHGIHGELKSFDDGNVALDALLTGAGDLGCTVESAGIARRVRGGQIFVTGLANYSANFHGLAGLKSINKAEDMIGKTIGVGRGTSAHLFFTVYARHFGIDLSKFNFRFLAAPESVAALARGDVDVICIGEPWLSRGIAANPNTHIILMMGELGIYRLTDYFYYNKRLMDDRPLGQALMQALLEAHDWTTKNLEEATRLGAEAYKLDYAMASNITKMFTFAGYFSPEIKSNMIRAAEFMKSINLITELPNWEEYLRPEVMQAAAPERVTAM